MPKPPGGCAGAVDGGPCGPWSEDNVELQHLMDVTPSSHHPNPVVQRLTLRRKMQLQLFAFCLSGVGLKVLKTYICASLMCSEYSH